MRVYLALIVFLIASHGRAQNKDVLRMSLEDCINYALGNNEQLEIAELEKDISDAVVGETRAQGLPQVDINTTLNHNYEVQKSLIDLSNFDPSVPEGTEGEIAFGQAYDGNLALGIRQLLFDGSYFVGLQAAKTFRELSSKEQIKTQIDVIEAVSKAYYNVLINSERLLLLDQNYDRLDTLLFETSEMVKNGFAEQIDEDRIRVNFNNVRVERDRTRKLNEISIKLLKFQMGMDIYQPVLLTDDLADVELQVPVVNQSSFDYNNRIEYSQVITNQNLARLDMKNNKSQYLPTLYANLNYGYNTATAESSNFLAGDRWLNYGTIGVTLSVPVFDGLRKSYKVQQNRKQIDQLEFQKSYLAKSIDIEVEQSKITLESNMESLEVSRQNMALAENIFNITKIKFQEGVGSNLEVIEADTSLKEAQTNYYNALYDAIIAKIDLDKALGRLNNQDQ
ncbi:MAG: TolC family protein [Cyclobacteriaceae bacterium]|nr:TolC family protein [Cyclobacteriaceae bacterium HetDA_MAG_MS6]